MKRLASMLALAVCAQAGMSCTQGSSNEQLTSLEGGGSGELATEPASPAQHRSKGDELQSVHGSPPERSAALKEGSELQSVKLKSVAKKASDPGEERQMARLFGAVVSDDLRPGSGLALRGGPVGIGGKGAAVPGRANGRVTHKAAAFGASGAQFYAQPLGHEASGAESYADHGVNDFTDTAEDPLSTFAVDVDTGSYTIARRKILEGTLPPRESVRVEEFLNYFRYSYPPPARGTLGVHLDAAPSPFGKGRHLLRVGIQGRKLSVSERKPVHLTFLVDVSGSMQSPDKLPLVQRSLRLLVDNLRDGDTVSLVTYAGSTRVVLTPTGLEKKALIHAAIADLTAGGSTSMGSGIQLAYREAMKTVSPDSTSRVVILSDGDANVGPTSPEEIVKLIAGYVKEGITVTVVGFGMGNYRDDVMEQFANKGNGNYFYVDSMMEAKRVFQKQLGGTLEVIAQDVKLQVKFDPKQVKRYRLIGYENRNVADRDFRNDKVDAGEIGSGHTVTALYEVELADGAGDGLCAVHVRAKQPRKPNATEAVFRFDDAKLAKRFDEAPRDLRFAAAVMGAAEIFRQSPHARTWRLPQVREIARGATGAGEHERQEFLSLLDQADAVVGHVAVRD